MSEGYIYCFSNPSMPGILKVGMTERTPETRLNEANSSDTPTQYKIVIAKKVLNPKEKVTNLHKILSKYTERTDPRLEFFRVSQEEVKTLFDLIDGKLWIETPEEEEEDTTNVSKIGCRDMTKCFTDGQTIRHTIGNNKTWNGIYNSSKNGIDCGTKFYKSLSGFAETHYSIDRTDRVKSANGWKECECEVNGEWISTFNL